MANIPQYLKAFIATLKPVATSGVYSDLTGKPSISAAGLSGAYSDLTGKPTLGTSAAIDVGTSANKIVQLTNDGKLPAVDGSLLTGINASANNAVPYSVNSAGKSNGFASFISKVDNSAVSFSFSTPVKICYPDGTTETCLSSTNLSNITEIATNGTAIIIKEKAVTTPVLAYIGTNSVTESIVAPSSPANGDYWLDISAFPYASYKRIAGAWVATQYVKLGEFTRSAGVIGTPVSYALNGIAKTAGANLIGAGSYVQNHNLGYVGQNVTAQIMAICTVATNGFAVGDAVILTHSENSGASVGYNMAPSFNRLQVAASIDANVNATNPAGSAVNIVTAGVNKFNIAYILKRNF